MEKNVLIIGCGITGESIYLCLREKYNIYLYDDKPENGKKFAEKFNIDEKYILHNLDNIPKNIDFAVISPGIRTRHNPHKLFTYLHNNGIKVISDFDLMFENLSKKQKIIGITGTNGKTTTTSLMAFVLEKLGKKSIACGNIGKAVLSCDFNNTEYLSLECSSYQLEVSNIEMYAGILLNISQDHIDHHGNMEEYSYQKSHIFRGNKISIISVDDEYCRKIGEKLSKFISISCEKVLQNGYSFWDGKFYKNGDILEATKQKPQLIGVHNMQNILAVLAFCIEEGFELNEIWNAICEFSPLSHRMEKVRVVKNITFINDSKATNPNSTRQAVIGLDEIYLIAGGVSKYKEAVRDIADLYHKIKKIYLIGEAAEEFLADLPGNVNKMICKNMKNATEMAYKDALMDLQSDAIKSPIVLLSPMCASFDQYKNFEERGDDFKNIVNNIIDVS